MISEQYVTLLGHCKPTSELYTVDMAWYALRGSYGNINDLSLAAKMVANAAYTEIARSYIETLPKTYEHATLDYKFKALLHEAKGLHERKNAGYSGVENPDPWANFRECQFFGISPAEGCLVRMCDKYARYCRLRENAANDKVNESLEDTLMDLAAYALIFVCLLSEK